MGNQKFPAPEEESDPFYYGDYDFIGALRELEDLNYNLSDFLNEALSRVIEFTAVATQSTLLADDALNFPVRLSSSLNNLYANIDGEKSRAIARIRYILGADNAYFMEKARLLGTDNPNQDPRGGD